MALSCFKAYDVRARVPEELNSDIAYRIGRAYAEVIKPSKVVVGYDIRLTSPDLAKALASGLMDAGVDVFDIGLCGTEEIYFDGLDEYGDDEFVVDFSNLGDFNLNGGSDSDTLEFVSNDDTGDDITSDTPFGFNDNLNNLEEIDYTNLTFNVGNDSSDGGTKAEYTIDGKWVHDVSANNELTIRLDSDDASKLEFTTKDGTKYGGDDSDHTDISNGDYTLYDSTDDVDVTLHVVGL